MCLVVSQPHEVAAMIPAEALIRVERRKLQLWHCNRALAALLLALNGSRGHCSLLQVCSSVITFLKALLRCCTAYPMQCILDSWQLTLTLAKRGFCCCGGGAGGGTFSMAPSGW